MSAPIRHAATITILAIAIIIGAFILIPQDEPALSETETVAVLSTPRENLPRPASNAAYISREDDGYYWTRASVDGTSVEFLVDTGASVVALTWRDAQRLRLKPEELDFRWAIRTANGETHGASVTLPSIRIGNVRIENVNAMVMQDGLLDSSLLGMSFLGELYSYEFRGDTLIIRE